MHGHNDFQVHIIRNMEEKSHLHPDVELLYVLEGELCVIVHEKEYLMRPEDVLLINSSIRHSISSKGKSILCRVAYNYQILANMLQDANGIILCNSVSDHEKSYEQLRALFRELVYLEVAHSRKSESYKYSLLYRILDQLIENFISGHGGTQHLKDDSQDEEKLQEIIRYVYQNFQDVVSLTALAEQMNVSKSTLSRFFKKQTGVYFAEYVNQIRLDYAVQALLHSERNITKIAMDCGFSNTSVFDKLFRENFGMSPLDYRISAKNSLQDELEKEKSVREQFREELAEKISILEETEVSGQKCVDIDVQATGLLKKNWNKVINIGSAHSLTLANVQYHLLYLVEHLGFTYARIWSIFDKRLAICNGNSIGAYNYNALDSVLDFLVYHHIIPYLDFSRRPNTAIRSAGDAVYYNEEGIVFTSREVWEAMFEDFIRHVLRRYGKTEVESWIFEISRDPVHGKNADYYEDPDYSILHVYRFAYRTIKELLPDAAVGGFGGIIDIDAQMLQQFLEYGKKEYCVPDFVSVMLFPYIMDQEVDDAERLYKRSKEHGIEMQMIRQIRQTMKESGLDSCKLYVCEWNNTVSNRNYLNDSCFRGTYICKNVSEMLNMADLLCIWMGSDWVSSYYDTVGIVNGGSGILTKDGIRKPAFFALQFLNNLGDQLVAVGDHYIVTKKESGSYWILCFNFKRYSARYFQKKENSILPQEMDSIFYENQSLTINITLNHMEENTTYIIKKRGVSQKNGSVLDEWGKFHFEQYLERTDIKYLQEICIPHLEMEKKQSQGDRLHLHLKLEKHEFAVYHIYKGKQ